MWYSNEASNQVAITDICKTVTQLGENANSKHIYKNKARNTNAVLVHK